MIVTTVGVVTMVVLIAKLAVLKPAGTASVSGTEATVGLELASVKVKPDGGAA